MPRVDAHKTNQQACLGIFGNPDLKNFLENYRRLIDEIISQDKCRREPAWTGSIAVGSKDFVGAIEEALVHRRFETEHLGSDAWALRESAREYDALAAKNSPEIPSKAQETIATTSHVVAPIEDIVVRPRRAIVVSRRNRAAIRTFRLSPFGAPRNSCSVHAIRSLDLPLGRATGLGEGGEETFVVRVVAEDFLAAIPAIDDVTDRTGIQAAR